jgi:phage terminase small subunit
VLSTSLKNLKPVSKPVSIPVLLQMKQSRSTERQSRFVDEYLVDLNATQAARRAGYSPRSARQAGAQNLSNPAISAEIAARTQALAARNGLSVDEYVRDLWERISADLADLFGPDDELLPIDKWPEVWRRGLVTRLRIVEERVNGQLMSRRITSIRFADRTPLKYLLGKHLGEFK